MVECLTGDREVLGLSLTLKCVVSLSKTFYPVCSNANYAEVSGYRAGYSGIFSIIGIRIF